MWWKEESTFSPNRHYVEYRFYWLNSKNWIFILLSLGLCKSLWESGFSHSSFNFVNPSLLRFAGFWSSQYFQVYLAQCPMSHFNKRWYINSNVYLKSRKYDVIWWHPWVYIPSYTNILFLSLSKANINAFRKKTFFSKFHSSIEARLIFVCPLYLYFGLDFSQKMWQRLFQFGRPPRFLF